MTIYLKRLTTEERATWGTCPICEALHGELCVVLPGDAEYQAESEIGPGAHTARLFNAPMTAAVDDGA